MALATLDRMEALVMNGWICDEVGYIPVDRHAARVVFMLVFDVETPRV